MDRKLRYFLRGVALSVVGLTASSLAYAAFFDGHVYARLRRHTIAISADGSFVPSTTEVAGVVEVVHFTSMEPTDSIVPWDGSGDPCDPANKVTYDDDIQGPDRLSVPGIFIRGPDPDGTGTSAWLDGGPEIIAWPGTCPVVDVIEGVNVYDTGIAGCCDNDSNPGIGLTRALCDNQDGVSKVLPDEVWEYPGVAGELVLVEWEQIEATNGVFTFDQIGHELDNAADNGKHIMVAIKTGHDAVPSWLFTGTGVAEVELKGTNSDSDRAFSSTSCGQAWSTGSFADPDYVTQLNQVIAALAAYVKSDPAWVQAISGAQLMGVQIETAEFQALTTSTDAYVNTCAKGGSSGTHPELCATAGNGHKDDSPGTWAVPDGVLDSYTGSDCFHNTAQWAFSGWTREGLINFVDDQVDTWQTEFWPEFTVRYGLKQSGLPSILSATQFSHDDLRKQDGTLVCPACAGALDSGSNIPSSSNQVDGIIARGLSQHPDTQWNMHLGLDPLPMEFEGHEAIQNCTYGGTPDLTVEPPVITFPIPLTGPKGSQDGCPNKWANNTTISPPVPYMTGFQTNNVAGGGIDSPRDLESALFNLERNTNAIELDVYLHAVFENHELNGSGDMTPERETTGCGSLGFDPAMCYSKSFLSHYQELVDRRESPVWTHSVKAFPVNLDFTYDTPGTLHFYNPRTCADGVGKSITIIVE